MRALATSSKCESSTLYILCEYVCVKEELEKRGVPREMTALLVYVCVWKEK